MNKLIEKHKYTSPTIDCINLDNEISLILVSGNPGDPFGQNNNQNKIMDAPEYFNTNPTGRDFV